jgi:Domain of unknown function (DUF4424)
MLCNCGACENVNKLPQSFDIKFESVNNSEYIDIVTRSQFNDGIPDDMVSLCFLGKPFKTSPTTIEFSQSNFIPQDKLIVFFYQIIRP